MSRQRRNRFGGARGKQKPPDATGGHTPIGRRNWEPKFFHSLEMTPDYVDRVLSRALETKKRPTIIIKKRRTPRKEDT